MAKTLCRVAGGGKPLKGNAEAGDVLAGKTFSNKQSNALTGTMPNNGAWSSSTSGSGTVAIPAGYHNGSGYVDCSGAYYSGYTNGNNDGKWSVKNSGQNVSLNGVKGAADQYTFTFNGRAGYNGVIFELKGMSYWIYVGESVASASGSASISTSYNSSTGVVTISAYRHTKLIGTIYYY